MTLFPNKVTFWGTAGWGFNTHIFKGLSSTHNIYGMATIWFQFYMWRAETAGKWFVFGREESELSVSSWFAHFICNFTFRKRTLDSLCRHLTFVTQAYLLVLLVARELKDSKALIWPKEATLWSPAKEVAIKPWSPQREWQTSADTPTPTGRASPSLGSAK